VLEAFFPEAAPASGRHRLRQVLTRLRATAGAVELT
jgi:DNA-binding SARP family transcriptional activator